MAHYLRLAAACSSSARRRPRRALGAGVRRSARMVAVELNRAILQAVNGVFGDVTGHLDRDPRVEFVNDEARSYLARTTEKFDFIQISLIDTWAATAAGAFVLSENTLYTTDAWDALPRRLDAGGLLSVSRWYYDHARRDVPRDGARSRRAGAARCHAPARAHGHHPSRNRRGRPDGSAGRGDPAREPVAALGRRRGRPGGGGAPPALRRHPLPAPSRRLDVPGAHQRAGPRGPLRAVPGEHRAAHGQQPVLLPHRVSP